MDEPEVKLRAHPKTKRTRLAAHPKMPINLKIAYLLAIKYKKRLNKMRKSHHSHVKLRRKEPVPLIFLGIGQAKIGGVLWEGRRAYRDR